MADDQIKIIINAEDKASGVMNNVAKNSSGLSGALKGLAGIAGVAVVGAFAGLTAAAVSGAKSVIEAQKRYAALEAVLKSTGQAAGLTKQDIIDNAAAISKLTNFTKGAVIEADNLLLRFTNIKGPVFKEANMAIANMATALGTDLTDAAQTVGKALNSPEMAIRLLKSSGIAFTDSQKEMIKTMVKTGDTMGAQNIILGELNKRFGGQAVAAADTFSGKMIQLQKVVEQFKMQLGELLIKALTPVLSKLLEFAQSAAFKEAFDKFVKALSEFGTKAAEIIADTIPKLIDGAKGLIEWFKQNEIAVYALAAALSAALIPAFTELFTTLATDLQQFAQSQILNIEALINPWTLVAIAAAAAAYLIISNWDSIKQMAIDLKNYVMDLWNTIAQNSAVQDSIKQIKASFDQLWNVVLTQLWPALQQLWATVQTQLLPAFQQLWIALQPLIPVFAKILELVLLLAVEALIQLVKQIINVTTFVVQMLAVFVKLVNFFVSAFADTIKNVTDDINAVTNAIKSLVDWVDKAISKLAALNVSGKIGGAANSIGNALGFRASGGPVSGGSPYIVGERGPELFVPGGGGSIIPNGGFGLSGVVVNITGTFLSEDAAERMANVMIDKLKLELRI